MLRLSLTLLPLMAIAAQAAATVNFIEHEGVTYEYEIPAPIDDYAYSIWWHDGPSLIDQNPGRFGNILTGASASKTLRFENHGRKPLTIQKIQYPPPFTGPAWSGTLKFGESIDLVITFRPKRSGTYRDSLRVIGYGFHLNGGAEMELAVMELRGSGRELIQADGDTAFGDQPLGISADSTVTLRSARKGTWGIVNVVCPGGFAASWQNNGDLKRLQVIFTPEAAQSYNGNLAVHYEHAGYGRRVYYIAVSGRGSDSKTISQRLQLQPWNDKKFGDPPFRIVWESRSGIKPKFRSSNPKVAIVQNGSIIIRGGGVASITAEAEGSGPWKKSTSTHDLIVRQASQTVIFNTPTTPRKFRGPGSSFALSASATSNLPVEFTSSDNTVLSVDGSRAVLWGRGQARIMAWQKGDKNYRAAKLTRTFRIE